MSFIRVFISFVKLKGNKQSSSTRNCISNLIKVVVAAPAVIKATGVEGEAYSRRLQEASHGEAGLVLHFTSLMYNSKIDA